MNASTSVAPAADGLMTPVGPPKKKVSLFRRLRPFLLGGAVIAAAIGGTWYWTVERFMQSTDNATLQGDISVLSSRIEGDVAELLVADNQQVKAGDPLIRLEDRDWQSQVAVAEASLAEANASIDTLREQIVQQRAQIDAAQAQIVSAEAERLRAAADARRTGDLVGGGYTSRQSQDRAVADLRKAEAAVAANTAAAAVQRLALPVLEANAAQATARRDRAQAQLELARSNLSYTVIRAPFDGVAGNRAAQLGQHVRPGQMLIAVAPPPDRQWVVANFKETQLTRMRPGQPVSVEVDALPGVDLHGRLESIAPATGAMFSLLPPENATGNFTKIVQRVPIRVTLNPEDAARLALLRPGLSVTAVVDTRDDTSKPTGLFASTAAAIRGLVE